MQRAQQLRLDRKWVHGHDMLYVRTAGGARAGSINLGSGKITIADAVLAEPVLAMIEQWRAEHDGEATGADVRDVDTAEPRPIDVGVPGGSARAEYERRRAKRGRSIEATWGTGRLGKLAKALSDDPRSTKAWAKGAAGEEQVARVLHQRLGDRAVILHDRRVPRTRANIDHLVVASSGVWVIDAKQYKGKVERRDVGSVFKADERLYVGGRDRTKLIDGVKWQTEAVQSALGDLPAALYACLSFVDAQWPGLGKPFQLDGVWISRPKKLAELAAQPGPFGPDEIELIAVSLAERLPTK